MRPAHTVTRKYYPAGGRAVALRTGGDPVQSGLYYLLADHLGSTTVTLKDTGSGLTKTGELRYKPWGETRFSSGTTPTNRHFTGQIEDSYINLYWYGSRWYDPALGRSVSPNSLIPRPYNPLDWVRYPYARNNPIKVVVPTGMSRKLPMGQKHATESYALAKILGGMPIVPNVEQAFFHWMKPHQDQLPDCFSFSV